MLGKVIKYDFKSIGKKVSVFFLGYLLIALLARIFGFLADKQVLFSTVSSFLKGITIVLTIGVLFYLFFIIIRRFYISVFKNEGYLTNTLPIQKSDLLISNLITTTIYTLLAIIVMVLALALAFYSKNNYNMLINGFEFFGNTLGLSVSTLVLIIIGFTLLTMVSNIQLFIASLALGHTKNSNKLGMSIVWGFVLYTITQIIGTIGVLMYYPFNRDIIDKMNADPSTVAPGFMSDMLIIALIITVITMIGYYVVAKISMNKKLNLD